MSNYLEQIESIFKQDGTRYFFERENNVIIIPYQIGEKDNIATINIAISNKIILMLTKIKSDKDLEWCNNFNKTHIMPKAYLDTQNHEIILDCMYDLNIFSDENIGIWVKTALFVSLKTIKNEIL